MRVFITGSAGFVGFHIAQRFLDDGHEVVGYDGFTDYYDPALKRRRTQQLSRATGFDVVEGMLEDAPLLASTIKQVNPDIVIHLAAQAGVRYSVENPGAYIASNVVGTANLLEALRHVKPLHLLFASTSSVYGANKEFPFGETSRTAFPLSTYAATKVSGEALTHAYASLFDIPTTCFRFFTVYGPWGRPDMALFKFVDRIRRGEAIDVYGNGQMSRDFTYIDDLVEAVVRLSARPPEAGAAGAHLGELDSVSPVAPWRVVNIAGGQPVTLREFITAIEEALGMRAEENLLPMQMGDVTDTLASPRLLRALTEYAPNTSINTGVQAFVEWFTAYQREEI